MPQIGKFGLKQIGETTPTFIKRLKQALNFLSGSIVVFLPQIAEALHTTTDALTMWMGLFIIVVNFVGMLFGVDPDATK